MTNSVTLEREIMKKPVLRSKEEWEAICERLEASGLSMAEFSRRNGIASETLRFHVNKRKFSALQGEKLQPKESNSPVSFTTIDLKFPREVPDSTSPTEYTISLVSGRSLQIRGCIDINTIGMLLKAIDGDAKC